MPSYYQEKFKCTNKKCSQHKHIRKIYVWSDKSEDYTNKRCGQCEHILSLAKEEINRAPTVLTTNPAKIQKMLTKRSHEHYEKVIKESKRETLKSNNLLGPTRKRK